MLQRPLQTAARAVPTLDTHPPPPECCVCTAAALSWLSYRATAPHAAATVVSTAQPSQARTTIALQAVGMRACGRHRHRQKGVSGCEE
eukprot:COSAG01_NODE_3800_length_5685_cov_4.802542_2_plen_88_part_00